MAAHSLSQPQPNVQNLTAIDVSVDEEHVSFTLCWEVTIGSLDHVNVYHDDVMLGRSYSTRFRVVKLRYHSNKVELRVQPVTGNGFKYFGDKMSCFTLNIVWL